MLSIALDAAPERIAAGKLASIYEDDTLTYRCRFECRYLLHFPHCQRSKFLTRKVGSISVYSKSQGAK